jgi:hypothetical protein
MRLRTMSWWSIMAFGVAVAGFISGSASRATAADATGTWKWSRTTQNGDTIDVTLKLKQDGEKLTGTITGFQGAETEITEGKVSKDGAISFTVVREFNDNKITQKYSGKQDGNTIKGKIERERNGETVSNDWEAKRS